MGMWNPRSLQNEADKLCPDCRGKGMRLYADTTMELGGPGGQIIMHGPCTCTKTWQDLRAARDASRQGGPPDVEPR